MHQCGFKGEQEKCPEYRARCDKPGRVDMTCLWYRRDYLGKNGGSICTKALDKETVGVYKEGT